MISSKPNGRTATFAALLLAASPATIAKAQARDPSLVTKSPVPSSAAVSPKAQTAGPTFVLTTPEVETTDENNVSLMDGRVQVELPLVSLGSVKYVEFNRTGIRADALYDENYGYVVACASTPGSGGYGGSSECWGGYGTAVQTVFGKIRTKFYLSNGQYSPDHGDGETFTDSGSTCTWTQADGTQVIYNAYHQSGNPTCQSQNISKVVYPDGRVVDYYYYGALSTTAHNPLLSIASSDGFMLRYVYSGTPVFGRQTSVVGVNRAFQACDPAAVTCSLSGAWPTATFASQSKNVSPQDNVRQGGTTSPATHTLTTIVDQESKTYVFEVDSSSRIISYQPPGAQVATTFYTLCTLASDPSYGQSSDVSWPLANCFGQTSWRTDAPADTAPALIDNVYQVVHNGQTWQYGSRQANDGGYPYFSRWTHAVTSPLNVSRSATGNSTPGMESSAGPTDQVSEPDGTVYKFEASVRNVVLSSTGPDGAATQFGHDGRGNLTSITRNPSTGNAPPLVKNAQYPPSCPSLITCNKPTYAIDPNRYETDYTYDSTHGGLLTDTGPAVNNVRPQKRYTYSQRYAWYFSPSGSMTRETRPIWVMDSESHCRTGAASGNGCAVANDEVVTRYDYGLDSGPNNLLVRGVTVTWNGQTHRTCYGHDRYGHKIWEQSADAGASSCPAY